MKLLFGMFVLWINWYSFNVGSTTKVGDGGVETAGRVAVVTTMAAASGAVVSMVISDAMHSYIEPEGLVTGILSALVRYLGRDFLVFLFHLVTTCCPNFPYRLGSACLLAPFGVVWLF